MPILSPRCKQDLNKNHVYTYRLLKMRLKADDGPKCFLHLILRHRCELSFLRRRQSWLAPSSPPPASARLSSRRALHQRLVSDERIRTRWAGAELMALDRSPPDCSLDPAHSSTDPCLQLRPAQSRRESSLSPALGFAKFSSQQVYARAESEVRERAILIGKHRRVLRA